MTFTQYPEGKVFSKITLGEHHDELNLPPLLFIHAAIADHTLWDDQVKFLSSKGYTCIQYDLFGFGSSEASHEYLESKPRANIDHVQHIVDLITGFNSTSESPHKVILVGLSMGGGFAIRTATMHPELVCGVVAVASGVPGHGGEGDPKEMELDAEIESLIDDGSAERAAKLQVHYWGDGPLQVEERCNASVRERLYNWCVKIAKQQHEGTGGFAFPTVRRPAITAETLASLDMPFAVSIGKFDETSVNSSQEYLAESVKDADLKRFDAAHVINLECPKEFNEWFYSWLEKKFGNH